MSPPNGEDVVSVGVVVVFGFVLFVVAAAITVAVEVVVVCAQGDVVPSTSPSHYRKPLCVTPWKTIRFSSP